MVHTQASKHTRARTHIHTRARARALTHTHCDTHTHTHTHTPAVYFDACEEADNDLGLRERDSGEPILKRKMTVQSRSWEMDQ